MVPVIPTGIKSAEEVDKAEEVPAAEAAAITVTVAETTRSLINIHLKEK